MRSGLLIAMITAVLILSAACRPPESEAERHREANTAAGKLGQAAHKVTVEADKASRVLAKELGKQAHQAHEGWREDARKDDQKK